MENQAEISTKTLADFFRSTIAQKSNVDTPIKYVKILEIYKLKLLK